MVEIEETRKFLGKPDATESSLLVVAAIPAYNEEKTIARVVLGAQKHAHIVVVCDDGSKDLTGEIAERLGAVVVRHERNIGYGAALESLFTRARELKADVLVTLDADGQHNPSEIPRLVKPIEDGVAEVVLGSRFVDKNGTSGMPAYRRLGVKVVTKLSNGDGKNGVSDSQSGFRAYSKTALGQLGAVSENGMGASVELIRTVHKNGLKVCEVPISCKYGSNNGVGKSNKNPVTHGIGLIMSLVRLVVEDRPVTLLGIPGALSVIIGTFFGVWMLNAFEVEHRIITNIALASIAFILIGFFMLSTAIMLYAISRLSRKMNGKK